MVRSIHEKYLLVLDKISGAEKKSGREPNSVKLVVVTKSQPVKVAQAAIEAGVKILGENYPEEGAAKVQALGQSSPVEWHMIGHVQSRKAHLVPPNFNILHSLDSLKLAKKLNRFCAVSGRQMPVLLEMNVGAEQTKGGWNAWDPTRWTELAADLLEIISLPNIKIRGLMAMPPLGDTPEFSRPFFQKVKQLQGFLNSEFPQVDFSELSMGTSTDYEVAVEEGATYVRVGTAIVGARKYKMELE